MFDDVLRRKPNGARFYRCDLHVHTPQDNRFKLTGSYDLSKRSGVEAAATELIDTAIENGVEILGITEHNSVEWIEPIRKAAESRQIVIFPGFEINADSGAGGIHLLCLFEPDANVDLLDDLITQLGLPRNDRMHPDGSSKLCGLPLQEAVDFVTENGGLPIAAHVLRDHGILKSESMTGEVRARAWKNPRLLAAELPKSRDVLSAQDGFVASSRCRSNRCAGGTTRRVRDYVPGRQSC